MANRKRRRIEKEFSSVLREVRTKLHQIDQKLDHLIRNYRKYYFTTDFSDSSNHEFKS